VLWKGSRGCRGESAKTGLGRAGAHVKEKMAGYREGGVAQISEDIAEYPWTEPDDAVLIATGVVAEMVLILARK
jgi:hypothetical protein